MCLLAVLTWILARPAPEPESRPLAGLDTKLNYALHDFNGRLLDDDAIGTINHFVRHLFAAARR